MRENEEKEEEEERGRLLERLKLIAGREEEDDEEEEEDEETEEEDEEEDDEEDEEQEEAGLGVKEKTGTGGALGLRAKVSGLRSGGLGFVWSVVGDDVCEQHTKRVIFQ